jgi:DNA-binding LacI/PurR family transcriptional regulator
VASRETKFLKNSAFPETTKPTIRDVARMADVSPSTVSLVIQDKGNLPSDTRARVQDAIGRLKYRPLRSRRAHTRAGPVALIVEEPENPYYAELYNAVDAVICERGLLTVMISSRGSVERQTLLLNSLRELRCSGALLVPVNGSGGETLDAISQNSDIPIVLGVRHLGFGIYDYVGPNYFLGMQLATRHVLALGHKRIAFVGGLPENSAYYERVSGFRICVASASPGSIEAIELQGSPTIEFGASAMAELGMLSQAPTAVIGYNDLVSFGLMFSARESGLTVGRDITVVGFDDIRGAAQLAVPLTTISTPPSRIGAEMARLLTARFDKPAAEPVNIIPPPVLKIRKSCGPPPGGKPKSASRPAAMGAGD